MPYPTKFSAIIEGNSRYFYEKRHRRNVWPPRQLFGRPNTGSLKRKKIYWPGHRKEQSTPEQYSVREEDGRKESS